MINPDVWIKRSKGGWTLAITEADVDVAREENVEESRSRAISGRWSGLRGFTCQTCHLHTTSYSSITPKSMFSKPVETFCQNSFSSSVAETHKYCFYPGYGNPRRQGCSYPVFFHTFCSKSKSF